MRWLWQRRRLHVVQSKRRHPLDAMAWIYAGALLWALIEVAEYVAPHQDLSEEGCRIGFVYDGDTVELICDGTSERARLVGFDTPETGEPGCPEEAALGRDATAELRRHLGSGGIGLSSAGRDRYGRVLVRLMVDGRDVADHMIERGLAVRYRGGRRIDWCSRIERQDRQ